MDALEKVVQEDSFEAEVQYCDPDNCLRDCIYEEINQCDAVTTKLW